MLRIKTLKDINRLEKTQCVHPHFIHHLKEYFSDLHLSLGDGISLEEFSLEHHGYIIIIQPSKDNVRDFSDVGLNKDEDGLLGSCPEFVNLVKLENDAEFYQIGLLCNNDYMMIFYYPRSYTEDPEVIEFLEEYLTK